ncbi:MAG: hypothetical protein ACR2MP_28825 [Streptosporangiaceae bacterium]
MSALPGTRSLRFAVPERHRFRELQALEDAVNHRLARLMAACLACELDARGRCDEHACDVALIAGYLEAAHTTMGELSRATEGMRQDGGPSSPDGSGGHGA